jgi:hypothetical protein
MYLRVGICLLLAVCATSTAAAIEIRECRGAQGERVFSDRAGCIGEAVRQWSLPQPPANTTTVRARESAPVTRRPARGGHRSSAPRPAESYLCSSGNQTWYQHSPCRGSGAKGESVRQTRISREQACREVARAASVLRRGSERDERAGPYARATGRDPCR